MLLSLFGIFFARFHYLLIIIARIGSFSSTVPAQGGCALGLAEHVHCLLPSLAVGALSLTLLAAAAVCEARRHAFDAAERHVAVAYDFVDAVLWRVAHVQLRCRL